MGSGGRRHRRGLLKTEPRDASLGLALDAKTLIPGDELVFSASTAAHVSGDSKIDRRSYLQRTRARNVTRRASCLLSGSPCWSRLVLVAAVITIQAGLAESINLSEISSPKCLWMRLPHAVQIAILLLMVVLLYRVNKFFDKIDEASYARLSRAISGLAEVRKRAANRRTPGH